jgi:GT2 family glycosyltransferase
MSVDASAHPAVSFVISTFNRREVLLRTLGELQQCGLDATRFEILVVDNASHDYTAKAIAEHFPQVRAFKLMRNRGSCAKNIAIGHARGQFIVFLDDDSYPMPGSMTRMLEHFAIDPDLGAAVFTVTLPDGSRECSAYPDVFIGCGTAFRREALEEVGLLPEDFFMQAEEYDLSLRLLQAGWDIRTFDDLHVRHLKTPNARRSWRTTRLDVRNNLVVATRFFPKEWMPRFALDWMKRYRCIAAAKQQRSAFWIGLAQGAIASLRPGSRRPISPEVFERFTRMNQIEQSLRDGADKHALRSILFIDYGKNIFPYWLAAKKLGLKVVAIADGRMPSGTRYRGIPVVNDSIARRLDFDAAIVSNSSPVHAQNRAQLWRTLDSRPVLELIDSSPATKRTGLAA